MRDFFRGWRRKVGCVTLVMALAGMALWIRSRIVNDEIGFAANGTQYVVVSSHSQVSAYQSIHLLPNRVVWISQGILPAERTSAWHLNSIRRREQRVATSLRRMIPSRIYTFTYWSLVIPLTLLSAYLLLWKPRKRVKQDA
jgi:hypothetical protein